MFAIRRAVRRGPGLFLESGWVRSSEPVRGAKKQKNGRYGKPAGAGPGASIAAPTSSGSLGPLAPLFKPVPVFPNPDDINMGEEIAGKINKHALLKVLNKFHQGQEIRELAKEHGLDDYLYHQAYVSFRKFCMDVQHLPPELYVMFSDVLVGSRHTDDIFPYFLTHARRVFPHLECLDELKMISDLTEPSNWYPEARQLQRRVIFHAGPTNSGKTYHALERFLGSKSGVYCGPLKLLAVEVANKSNAKGVPCDLVTGEERKLVREDNEPAAHVSCTVEMTNVNQTYEVKLSKNPLCDVWRSRLATLYFQVAVIDEIQMVQDYQRGWAWTRALLGVPAQEVHVCGEVRVQHLLKVHFRFLQVLHNRLWFLSPLRQQPLIW